MNIEQHTTKIFIKSLPPIELSILLDKYQIPTPLKDLSKTEKNIAKTHMIYSAHSEEVY